MESAREDLCSVIQYYKGPETGTNNTEVIVSDRSNSQNSVKDNLKENLSANSKDYTILRAALESNRDNQKGETEEPSDISDVKPAGSLHYNSVENETDPNTEIKSTEFQKTNCSLGESEASKSEVKWCTTAFEPNFKPEVKREKAEVPESVKAESGLNSDAKTKETETKDVNLELVKTENEVSIKGKKRTMSEANSETASVAASVASAEEAEANEDGAETEFDEDDDEGAGNKLRRRGRCKKNPDIIPAHLSSDMVLGYKILLKFLETPQFSGFHKPFKKSADSEENCKITCLNQIKKKFEENLYKKVSEFVNDVREMLMNIYESRNQVAIKKALRLEQILEQRIAQLPNYLRPQCALVLSSDEVNNCHNKIRITKGGGFVSLLLEKTEKKRYEKNREKRKLLAEERKQLKEEQDKDVQEWEKNVLLKDFEEDIKSMWELPAIGHFIHLCADIFNIGEVAQFEVERMLLMPQCSDTLDLIMTALLTNCLVRAKLDRTPSMPYSIWGPLVRTRVMSWYRMWHRDGKNEQKIFEEIGIEPEFWQILGPDINPLDYYYFHEVSLLQRVWILKTLCDVDFVRKKTVYDNIRAQTLDELSPVNLGLDQQGNRYIQFKQFCGSDIRIYRQSSKLEAGITPSELIESNEGFEYREGPIAAEKVFKDIWELNEKSEVRPKKKKIAKNKRAKSFSAKISREPVEKKNLRQSAREKQKSYADWSDSDQSDTDLRTLRNKLLKSDTETLHRPFSNKEFISLSVFRLPREKVNKLTPKRSSYAGRRTEDTNRHDADKMNKTEPEERKEEVKRPCEDEQSDSLDVKQIQNVQADFEKSCQGDDVNEDEFELREKLNNCEIDNTDVKFTVKNLENLKMVFKKGPSAERDESGENISGTLENSKSEESTTARDKEYDTLYKYKVPNHLKPDSSKFYLVVDSVEGLRQLISKFGSHENDLEIITRSTKSKKKSNNTSCEVQLIEKLQNLLVELEPWELDLMKSSRLNKEKMYKEYMNFINRPPDFVHPNEAYWMKTYEEPNATTAAASTTTTTVTTTTTDCNATHGDKANKEGCATAGESADANQQDTHLDTLGLRKRTRVSRVQLQPESDDLDEDFDGGDDNESNESDDNWVLPTTKKRSKKETGNRTPKLPRRSVSKRSKSSPFEKTDSQANAGEKSQGSSPEKVKKALFWGPRSSDPSEDLNWETNRQKILEQHNSPIKKLLKPDETNDLADLENARQSIQKFGSPSQSVIMASPKSLPAPIPGNKKPYYSSTQLKAMESQAKKELDETQQKLMGAPNNISKEEHEKTDNNAITDSGSVDSLNQSPFKKVQTYSRNKKPLTSPPVTSKPSSSFMQSTAREGGNLVTTTSSQVVRYAPQVCSTATGGGTEQKQTGQVQILQPGIRPQQIQIQDLGQNRIITSNVKIQQPVQWQQKVISVQPVSQSGKIIQNQGQPQVQIQSQPQVQIQSQPQAQVQMQSQGQQTAQPEPQKVAVAAQSVQVPVEKLGNFLQMVTTQGQTETVQPEGDLFITDGKNLMKFDNNFVQELQKDKVMNLDLKKTLLLVKPKANSNQSTSQSQTQTPTSEQNILVINKPTPVQQPQVPMAFIANFVVPVNYVIKDGNQQTQGEQGQQTVKLVQPSPAYVIQQKPVINKSVQPQVIKIITTQPSATNQNIILAPLAGQVIQPVTQNSAAASEQQTKSPPALRLIRPPIATSLASSPAQNKISMAQNPIILNNIVQIQGQKVDAPKPQTSVVPARIVSTAVPTVRMATPQTVLPSTQSIIQTKPVAGVQSQTQTVVASGNLNQQGIRSNVITQPVRLATITQGQVQSPINTTPRFVVSSTPTIRIAGTPKSQTQTSTSLTQPTRFTSPQQFAIASTSNSHIVKPAGLNAQHVRLATTQPHTFIQAASINSQSVRPSAGITAQTVRLVSQPQFVQAQTIVTSTNAGPSSSSNSNIQSVKIVQPPQYQSQTVVPCVSLDSQTGRVATGVNSQPIRFVQSQTVRLIASNNADMKVINRTPTPVKGSVKIVNRTPAPAKAAVITSVGHTPVIGVSSVRPSVVATEPVRCQAIVQPSGAKPAQNVIQIVSPKKTIKANTLANAPILFVEEEEEELGVLGEKVKDPPVTFDFINGELSVKKTSQGWKYAVKASNGKDVILTDEQIEKRLKANNGVMK